MNIAGADVRLIANGHHGRTTDAVTSETNSLPLPQSRQPHAIDYAQAVEYLQGAAVREAQRTDVLPTQRANRAVRAYNSLDRATEKQFVSNLLGVDEYV